MLSQPNTEPASLGSESNTAPNVQPNARSRPQVLSRVARLTTIIVTAIGLIATTSSAAHSNQATAPAQLVQGADRAAEPGELRARSLAATKNELTRLTKANRTARKKAHAQVVRDKLVKFARKQVGDPYIAGHAGPDAFDCSGLVRYVFKNITGMTLPHYSKAQYGQVTKVKKSNAQPGDLVFFFEQGAHHVGIYIGNGKMIDAPRTGEHVRVSPISGSWWGRSYTGIGRILAV